MQGLKQVLPRLCDSYSVDTETRKCKDAEVAQCFFVRLEVF